MSTPKGPRQYRDQGIVLRGIRLGEADRILTIYTQSNGRVRAVAKGIRKMRSRFGARLDAFTHVDLLLHKGRDLDVVTEASILATFPRLRADYSAFTAAAAMADTVERATPERERNVRLFVLFHGALRALEAGAADPVLLAHAFLAKVTAVGGLHPVLRACVGCESTERIAFSHSAGGAVCRACVQRGDPGVSPAALDIWAALAEQGWEALRQHRLEPAQSREVGRVLVDFVQWQLDNRFRAFGLLAAP